MCGDARFAGSFMSYAIPRHTLAVICCFLPAAVAAQTAPSVSQLDQVVVTASRSAQLERDVLGDVTVIDQKELQKAGQDSVAEILSRQRGVQMYNSGGPQTVTSVFLRGANANQTLVLVDGMRINSITSGVVNWNAIDPAMIERIEIVRGAASSLYGSGAIGGVINIITKKGQQDRPFSAWADIGIGSYDTFKSALGFSGAKDGWDYALSSSMGESGGFNATNRLSPAFDEDIDGYSQHALSGSLGYTWQPGHHIGLTVFNGYMDGAYDQSFAPLDARTITRQQAYSVTSTDDITDYWQSVLRLAYIEENTDSRSAVSPSYKAGNRQRNYSWQHHFQIAEKQKVSLILERLEERPYSRMEHDINRRDTNAAGLVYQGSFDAHHLQASVRNDNVSGYGNQTTGGLGYEYDISEQWRVGVAGNTGFRAPTFNDLYFPFGSNPNLQAEKSRNLELSARYDYAGTRIDVVAFQNRIRNFIILDENFIPQNVERATIRGVSVSAEQDFGDTTLRASADFMNPRDDATGNQLPRRAKQVYRLGADHRFDRLSVGAEYQFVGQRYDLADNQTSLGGYGLFNLTAGYEFNDSVGVQVRWNNLFDKDYTNAYGYNMPGSNVFINLSFRM